MLITLILCKCFLFRFIHRYPIATSISIYFSLNTAKVGDLHISPYLSRRNVVSFYIHTMSNECVITLEHTSYALGGWIVKLTTAVAKSTGLLSNQPEVYQNNCCCVWALLQRSFLCCTQSVVGWTVLVSVCISACKWDHWNDQWKVTSVMAGLPNCHHKEKLIWCKIYQELVPLTSEIW